jgi:hypothetical protein
MNRFEEALAEKICDLDCEINDALDQAHKIRLEIREMRKTRSLLNKLTSQIYPEINNDL